MQQLMMTVAVTVETAANLLPEPDTRPFSLFSLLPEQRKTFNSVFVLWGVDVSNLCIFLLQRIGSAGFVQFQRDTCSRVASPVLAG